MGHNIIFTLILILFGIILLFLCNLISHSIIRKSEWFLPKTDSKLPIYYKFYQLLMVLLLVGYVFVFCFILSNVTTNNIIFLGIALFVGTSLALLGLIIYSNIISRCNAKYDLLIEKYNKLTLKNKQFYKIEESLIFMFAHLVQVKDYHNEDKHIFKNIFYIKKLLKELLKNPKFFSVLSDDYIADLIKTSPIFDLGKLLVHDSILQKKGKLSTLEFQKMQMHCQYGVDLLNKCIENLGFNPFMPIAIQLTYSHHERWDGKGYPCGLKEEEIPLPARIVSLVSVFNALRSERTYKSAFSKCEIIDIIREERGKHFDPDIVDAFLAIKDTFFEID